MGCSSGIGDLLSAPVVPLLTHTWGQPAFSEPIRVTRLSWGPCGLGQAAGICAGSDRALGCGRPGPGAVQRDPGVQLPPPPTALPQGLSSAARRCCLSSGGSDHCPGCQPLLVRATAALSASHVASESWVPGGRRTPTREAGRSHRGPMLDRCSFPWSFPPGCCTDPSRGHRLLGPTPGCCPLVPG